MWYDWFSELAAVIVWSCESAVLLNNLDLSNSNISLFTPLPFFITSEIKVAKSFYDLMNHKYTVPRIEVIVETNNCQNLLLWLS